jgi:hypothetical protein
VALLVFFVSGCGKINAGASPQPPPPSYFVARTTTTTTSSPTDPNSAPVAGPITSTGRLLWNLEALLRATFGSSQPFSSDTTDSGPTNPSNPPADSTTGNYIDFNCAGLNCSPLAVYDPYWYTFADPTDSSFHVSHVNYKQWSFGNYPEPVLINGRIVACDTNESTFLIRYADAASFTLACIAPLSR